MRYNKIILLPKLAECLAELRVVERGVLVREPPPGSLGPHHEGVHRPLHVGLLLLRGVPEIKHCWIIVAGYKFNK